jgi:ribosomal protein L23
MSYFSIPSCAYITFTTQEAKERCEKYLFIVDSNGHKNKVREKISVLGVKPIVEKAREPSDIIWHNVGV